MKYFCHSNSCIRCSRSIAGRAGQDGRFPGCLQQNSGPRIHIHTISLASPAERRAACSAIWKMWWFSSQMVTSELKGRCDPPGRFEQRPTVVHAIFPGKGDPQDASISCRVLASAPFLHQASSLSDPSCSLFLSHFRLLVAYFISPHLVL